jgi:hypothetical protein
MAAQEKREEGKKTKKVLENADLSQVKRLTLKVVAPGDSMNCIVSRISATTFPTASTHTSCMNNPRPIPPSHFYATAVLKPPAPKPAHIPATKTSRTKRNETDLFSTIL